MTVVSGLGDRWEGRLWFIWSIWLYSLSFLLIIISHNLIWTHTFEIKLIYIGKAIEPWKIWLATVCWKGNWEKIWQNVCFLVTLDNLMALIFGFLILEMGTIGGWESVLSPLQICALAHVFSGLSLGFPFISFLAYITQHILSGSLDFVSWPF